MPPRFIDPFFPNRPVNDPEKFSGRHEQIDEAIDSLFQVANGNPKHTIITGDRGIGKSSLLTQIRILSEGNSALATKLNIDIGKPTPFNFLTAWHDAQKAHTPYDIVSGLMDQLASGLRRGASKFFSDLNIEIDVLGIVGIKKNPHLTADNTALVNKFCEEISKVEEGIKRVNRDGVLLFIDEIDRVDPESGIATFIKLATERLNREGRNNIAFICAGITGAVQKMQSEHASISRTFRDITIPRLTENEAEAILVNGFDKVQRAYDPTIPELAFRLSAGFPEPVHLLGSEMLSVDTDNLIDAEDFHKAKERIISDVRRNSLNDILKKAGSGKYQKIVKAMADFGGPNVPLENISTAIKQNQNQFSTNMATLVDRGVINRLDTGVYGFADPLLKEYVRKFGIINVDVNEVDN